MTVLRVDPSAPEAEAIARAAARLRRGELVAFPTETVYGLGADARDPAAIARIYAAKGRPSYNPLIVHVLDATSARSLCRWTPRAQRLADAFWPGPLTLVLPKNPDAIPDLATAGLPSVGLRAPAHPVARALLRAARLPVAAPSANRSQGISPTTAAHVVRSLDAPELLVLDGGPTRVGIESTVLDLCGDRPTLLRLGAVTAQAIEAEIGPIARAGEAPLGDGVARPSPGMSDRHYAPAGAVHLAPLTELHALLHPRNPALPGPTGALTLARHGEGEGEGDDEGAHHRLAVDHALDLPLDPRAYAQSLYAALHTLDALGCATVLIEAVPSGEAWAAIGDKLRRAAGSPTA